MQVILRGIHPNKYMSILEPSLRPFDGENLTSSFDMAQFKWLRMGNIGIKTRCMQTATPELRGTGFSCILTPRDCKVQGLMTANKQTVTC